jgi:hypothetical protein
LACTASDSSGLQNAADASFSLVTSVADGSETASALTSTRTVCDSLGNCAQAGPLGPVKVDKKAPVVSVTAPADGATYGSGETVDADFACSDGGSGVASCSGTASAGRAVDTSVGTHSFTVDATDNVGNSSSRTVTYTVSAADTRAPTVSCAGADGAWHGDDVSVACTASDGGSGLANPGDAAFRLRTSVALGSDDDDAATGSRQVCDVAGNCATAGPVAGNRVDRLAPSVSFSFSGIRTVARDGTLAVAYSCADGGSGVASCTGDAASGAVLDTSTAGIHYFHVTATDATGNSATRTATYIVSAGTSSSGPFQVTGTVTDQAGSSALLTGSAVEALTAGTGSVVASTAVAADGTYALAVSSGTYDIRVTPPVGSTYLVSKARDVRVDADTAMDFVLLPPTSSSSTTTMSGRISDPNAADAPLAGVVISDGSSSATTDAEGHYDLVTTQGSHVFTIALAGFSVQFLRSLNTGTVTQDLAVPGHQLTVHLADAAGQPVPGGAVTVSAPATSFALGSGATFAGGTQFASATTNAGGDATLPVIPLAAGSGTATFAASSAYQDATFSTPANSADTTVGVTVPGLGAQLTGRVVDPGGAALTDIKLQIGNRSVTTGPSGTFSLPSPTGSQMLHLGEHVSNKPSFDLDVPLTVAAGTTTLNLALPLKIVLVDVTDGGGQHVAGAHLSLSAPISSFEIAPGLTATGHGPQSWSQTTTTSGSAAFVQLSTPGSTGNPITFDADAPYADTTWDFPALTASAPLVNSVTVTVGALDAHFHGVVQDEAGDPLSGIAIALGGRAVATDAEGRYSLYSTAGAQTLTVTPSSPAVTLHAPVTLSGDTTKTLTLPVKRLTIRVLNASNDPLAGAGASVDAPAGDVSLAAGITATAAGNQSAAGTTDSHGDAALNVLSTTGGAGAGHVSPPGGLGLSAASFALPAINADTLLVVQYQGSGQSVATVPVVTCDAPPSGWQPDNVSVACAGAAVPPATLADPADAHFTLSTSVPDGTQTANAATGSHQVCASNGACASAASMTGIEVDRKAPSATVTTPADGATYTRGQNVTASYGCDDGTGGSGIRTTGGCAGSVAAGAAVDTSTTGAHTFAVSATDVVGHTTTKSVSYTVASNACGAGSADSYCQSVAATPGLANYFALDGTATRDPVGGVMYTPVGANLAAATGPRGGSDRALHIINYATTGRGSIQLTPSVNMSGTRPWTIEAWWKEGTDTYVSPHDQTLFGRFNDSGPTGCLGSPAACMHMNTSPGMRSVVARGDYSVISAPWSSVSDSDASGAPQWTLLAVTYDGATMRLYKDGVLQGQVASTVSLAANPITMFLTSNDAYWAKLAIYDHGLTATELLAHYQAR